MKFEINAGVFGAALSRLSSVVASRSTMPILHFIHVRVEAGGITLTGTDLEAEMTVSLPVPQVYVIGEACIHSTKLLAIVKALDAESSVTLKMRKGGSVQLSCGNSRFTLHTLPAMDFPRISLMDTSWTIRDIPLNVEHFLSGLRGISWAMADKDARHYLNGAYFELEDYTLRIVATDGHCLAAYTIQMSQPAASLENVIVPRKSVLEIIKLFNSKSISSISLSISDNHISLAADGVRFVSKLTSGRYPDYRRVIPTANNVTVNLPRQSVLSAVKRTLILSNETSRGIVCSFGGDLRLSSTNKDEEASFDQIDLAAAVAPVTIGVNGTYLLNALSVFDDDEIPVALSSEPTKPLLLTSNVAPLMALVMPMRL